MKISKYFSIVFLLIIFTFNLSIYKEMIVHHKIKKEKNEILNNHDISKSSNYVNWQKEYPIDNEIEEKNINLNKTQNKKILSKIKKSISEIETRSNKFIPARIKLVEAGHLINQLFGGNMFLKLDNMIRFNNGYFGFIISEKASFEADGLRTVEFAKYLNNHNIKFGYILCPSKFSKTKKDLPVGMEDYSNENADSFIKVLKDNNIPMLDLRDELSKDYQDIFDAFFKTDHHWKTETGFWGTQKIIKFLNTELKYTFDENIINKENFNFKLYPKMFLGSQGKKASLSIAEPDDFTLITPKFETDFSYEAYNHGIKKTGKFENSLLSLQELKGDYYNANPYGVYSQSQVARFINKLTANKNKIMIIKDSFVGVIAPFLACVTKEILLVDIRKDPDTFDGSIKKLIQKEKPDIVLILYHCGVFDPANKNVRYLHLFR